MSRWVLVVFLASSTQASGQSFTGTEVRPVRGIVILGVNVALGALTSGITRAAARKPIWTGVYRGGLGGGAAYLGKRIVARNDPWLNLLGREIAAVGSSVVANAAYGRATFARLVFPWGPVRVYVDRQQPSRVSVKLDLATALVTLDQARNSYRTLDVGRTMAAGVPVFSVDSAAPGLDLGGSHLAGVIWTRTRTHRAELTTDALHAAIGHELVHVLQYDFSFIVWTEPVETIFMKSLPGGERVHRYVDLGLNVPVWSGLNSIIPYHRRPWEQEAVTLARQ
jgi:hypothetical protein